MPETTLTIATITTLNQEIIQTKDKQTETQPECELLQISRLIKVTC